jgi:integrase
MLLRLREQSVNRQRKAKVVMGAMLDMAVRSGALALNPVRGSISISRPKSEASELSHSDVARAKEAVRAWTNEARPGPKACSDMADILDVLLGTGARIGEVLAIRWRDVDLQARCVEINGTVKTETGKGTYRKTLASAKLIELQDFAVAALRRRLLASQSGEGAAVFPTRNGTWQQVNNVERRWRQIREEAGLTSVALHAFRRGVVRDSGGRQ